MSEKQWMLGYGTGIGAGWSGAGLAWLMHDGSTIALIFAVAGAAMMIGLLVAAALSPKE